MSHLYDTDGVIMLSPTSYHSGELSHFLKYQPLLRIGKDYHGDPTQYSYGTIGGTFHTNGVWSTIPSTGELKLHLECPAVPLFWLDLTIPAPTLSADSLIQPWVELLDGYTKGRVSLSDRSKFRVRIFPAGLIFITDGLFPFVHIEHRTPVRLRELFDYVKKKEEEQREITEKKAQFIPIDIDHNSSFIPQIDPKVSALSDDELDRAVSMWAKRNEIHPYDIRRLRPLTKEEQIKSTIIETFDGVTRTWTEVHNVIKEILPSYDPSAFPSEEDDEFEEHFTFWLYDNASIEQLDIIAKRFEENYKILVEEEIEKNRRKRARKKEEMEP